MLYMKNKHKIVFTVVLVMLLQIVAPVAQNVYAATSEGNFRITGERLEGSTAYIDWEFDLDLDNPVDEFRHAFDFTTDSPIEDQDLVANDGTLIGKYSISAEGELIVGVDEEIYTETRDDDNVDSVDEEPADEEPAPDDEDIGEIDEENGADEDLDEEDEIDGDTETEDDGDKVEDEDDGIEGESAETDGEGAETDGEGAGTDGEDVESGNGDAGTGDETEGETEDGNGEASSEGYFRQHMVYASATEADEVKTLTGIIIIPKVTEKPSLFGKMMGLFGGGPKDLGDIFKFTNLWIGREYDLETGNVTIEGEEIEENTPVDLDGETTVTIRYEWDISGKDAQPGDTASIKIPDVFDSAGTFPESDILLSDGETKVGTWTVSDGYLWFTFNEGLDGIDADDLEGTFVELGFKLKMVEFKEDIHHVIEFKDSADKKFNLVIKPDTGSAKAITKKGIPDGTGTDGKKDAKSITWTIDVLNTEGTVLRGAVVSEDAIPEGLSLDTGSFTITELTMGYNGNINPVGSSKSISGPSDGGGFEINLPDMNPYSGYRIEYTTKIIDFSKKSFTNEAKLSKDGGDFLSAKGTVSNLTRSAPLEKSGRVVGSYADEIEWTIYINKGGISIENPVVRDILQEGLSVKEVKVYKGNDDVTDSEDIVIPGNLGELVELEIKLPPIGPDDIYRIVYITTVDYMGVNGGIYQEKNEFENEARLYDNTDQIGEESVRAIVTTTRKHLLYKDGSNPAKYGDTLSWIIRVNQAYHTINGAVLHDIIPNGLDFDPDNVTIRRKSKGSSWVTLTGTNRPTVSDMNSSTREVTINLGTIQDEYEITYTTQITEEGFVEGHKFKNKVWLTGENRGTGVGSGGTTGNPVTKELTPGNNSYNKTLNGNDAINYDEKTISWKIEIDPIKEPIVELKIIETFPSKGMIFLPDSLEITKGNTEITVGYILGPNTEGAVTGYQKGFILIFADGTSENPILSGQKMTITYETSYDPQLKVGDNKLEPYIGPDNPKAYKNEVIITGKTKSGKNINKPLEKSALVYKDGNIPSWDSGKKEGRRVYLKDEEVKDGWVSGKERLIEWKIYMNYLKQNLGKGVIVTDELQYDGEIDIESVEIKEYTVDPLTGDTTDTIGIVDDSKYSKELNGDQKLKITFNDEEDLTERYVIIFRTTVPDKSQGTYINDATVEVDCGEYPYSASISYNKHDSFIDKSSLVSGSRVYTDDEIDWELVINESLSTKMEGVEIVDIISEGLVFKNDSLEIYKVINGSNEPVGSTDYVFTNPNGNSNQLEIKFNIDIDHKYIIRYQTIVTATTGNVSNSAEITGNYITTETISGKIYSAEKFGFTGGILPDKGKIRIEKVERVGGDEKAVIDNNSTEAQFKLWYYLNDELVPFNEGEKFTAVNGILNIPNLPLREYLLEEVTSPDGYQLLEDKILVNVDKKYQNNENNTILAEVVNEKIKTEVVANKEWNGGPKPAIQLRLFRDGEQIGEPITLDGTENWTHTWAGLDKTDSTGTEYVYTVDEEEVPEYYDKTISEDGLTVTNTYVIPLTSVTGKKEWVDGPEVKPAIKLQLYQNEIEYGDPAELNGTEETPWTYTWNDLDKTDEEGVEHIYTVDEVTELRHYAVLSLSMVNSGL